MITRYFNLMLYKEGIAPVVNVNQYDQGEEWVFTLYGQGGVKYTPTTGAIVALKSDGHLIANAGTVDGQGRVVITETQQMTASAGKATCELQIDGDTHGTANFYLLVEPSPADDGIPSDSDLSLFQQAVDAVAEMEGLLDGETVDEKLLPIVQSETGDWLADHITNPSNPPIDTSLTVAGAAADAKVTGDEITDLKSAINHISETANLFGNTSDEIYQFTIVYNSGAIVSNTGGRVICVPCKPNTQYHITKNAGGRFVVGDLPATPQAGNTCTQYYADNTASSIYYTTSNSAKYLVAFVYYNATDGADYTTMLASVVVNEVSAIDYIARATTEKVENGYGTYNYNADLSLLTNSGSGRYIIGHAFPAGYIDSVFVDVAASSEVEVRLYTLDSGILNVAFYTTGASVSAGMLEIPIKKNSLSPFYIMINRISGSLMYRSNSAYDVYGVSVQDSYTLATLTASHYEFGISVKYGLFRNYTPLGKNYLLIGDSYLEGYSADGDVTSWGEYLQNYMGIAYNSVIAYKGGIGFIEGTGTLEGYSFKSLALNANVPDPNTITHIVVCGGYNDAVRSLSEGEVGILNAIEDFYNNVSPLYPNANIYIGMIGYRNNDDAVLSRIRGAGLSAYQTANRYGANDKIRYLNNVEWTLMSDDMSSDGYHPNAVGQLKLGLNIKNAILTGSAPIRTLTRTD